MKHIFNINNDFVKVLCSCIVIANAPMQIIWAISLYTVYNIVLHDVLHIQFVLLSQHIYILYLTYYLILFTNLLTSLLKRSYLSICIICMVINCTVNCIVHYHLNSIKNVLFMSNCTIYVFYRACYFVQFYNFFTDFLSYRYLLLCLVSTKVQQRRMRLAGHCVRHDDEFANKLVLRMGMQTGGGKKLRMLTTCCKIQGWETQVNCRQS